MPSGRGRSAKKGRTSIRSNVRGRPPQAEAADLLDGRDFDPLRGRSIATVDVAFRDVLHARRQRLRRLRVAWCMRVRAAMGSTDGTSARSARECAVLATKLLRATLASLRCRDLIRQSRDREARLELGALRDALDDAADLPHDVESASEIESLRTQERKLSLLLRPSTPSEGAPEPSPTPDRNES
jgi:hypothetical protein